MTHFTHRRVVSAEAAADLLTPRHDVLTAEVDEGDGCFGLAEGPFDHYRREVSTTETPDGTLVVETFDYRIAAPFWRLVLAWPVRRTLRREPLGDHIPWWAPPDRFDAAAARTISLLCVASIVAGYLGTVIGQTATFATDEFGATDRAQGILLAAVRVGTVITAVVSAMADHRGRRPTLLFSLFAACFLTIAGAASTGMVMLGVTQAMARGFSAAAAILLGVMAAETAPRSSRAYVASVLTLSAGLGAGMPVWFLFLADLDERGWRLIFLLAAGFVPVTWWLTRHLRETSRFEAHQVDAEADVGRRSDGDAMLVSRLVLVAAVAFLVLMFAAPASQFRNDFLRDERGFTAAQVSIFVLATNTPVGIGVAIAGKWSDRRGRRPVGAFAVFGGAVLTLATYTFTGWGMWVSSVFASIIGAMAAPSLGVYQAELFGTARRGRANGIVSVVAVAGSALGLILVGDLSDRLGSFSRAFAVVGVAPLIVVVLVLAFYPETAQRELEDINPTDR